MNRFKLLIFTLLTLGYCSLVLALDKSGVSGVDDMLASGQGMIKVAAKWGGITTIVGAAVALGHGRLEGALAQTICKILIVVGLLVSAFGFFQEQLSSFGFIF